MNYCSNPVESASSGTVDKVQKWLFKIQAQIVF